MASTDAHLTLLSFPRALPITTGSTNKTARQQEEGAEKAMSGAGTLSNAVAADTAVPPPKVAACYFCGETAAMVYCRADAAGLCLPCDRHVHGANTVSSRHARAPLCAACRAAGASVRRGGAARFLCSDCDFDDHQRRGAAAQVGEPPLHDRGTVEGYTGCPSVGDLAVILGVVVHGKAAADELGWWPVWEEPRVLTFDDVIVPTTSCHGLQPLLTSSSPKSRSPPCGELDSEVLRQLGELAKSEVATAFVEVEPAGDPLPPWASSDYGFGHGDLGALGTEAIDEEAANIAESCQNHEAWIAADLNNPPDARDAVALEQVPASSQAEPSLSTFVEMADVCPGMSRSRRSSSVDIANGGHDQVPTPEAVTTSPAPDQAVQPKSGGYDVAYPDRRTVISRYKEKRKNRIGAPSSSPLASLNPTPLHTTQPPRLGFRLPHDRRESGDVGVGAQARGPRRVRHAHLPPQRLALGRRRGVHRHGRRPPRAGRGRGFPRGLRGVLARLLLRCRRCIALPRRHGAHRRPHNALRLQRHPRRREGCQRAPENNSSACGEDSQGSFHVWKPRFDALLHAHRCCSAGGATVACERIYDGTDWFNNERCGDIGFCCSILFRRLAHADTAAVEDEVEGLCGLFCRGVMGRQIQELTPC